MLQTFFTRRALKEHLGIKKALEKYMGTQDHMALDTRAPEALGNSGTWGTRGTLFSRHMVAIVEAYLGYCQITMMEVLYKFS